MKRYRIEEVTGDGIHVSVVLRSTYHPEWKMTSHVTDTYAYTLTPPVIPR